MKFLKKIPKIFLILLTILILLVGVGILVVSLNLPITEEEGTNFINQQIFKLKNLDQGLMPEPTPSAVPEQAPTPTITPTPTLTPNQTLNLMNQKYGKCRYVPVLMYHHLLPVAEAKAINASWMSVAPEIFEEHLSYLQQKGYQTIFLTELMSGLNSSSLPAKPVVITFDDGYRELYDNLFPILKKYNSKVTLFLISQFMGGSSYLDWWQAKIMSESGLVEIGDHTLSHPSLLKNGEAEERNQILGAKNILESQLGISVEVFAYPYGNYNKTSENILNEGGFVAAVTTKRGNPVCSGLPFEIPRIRIGSSALSAYGL